MKLILNNTRDFKNLISVCEVEILQLSSLIVNKIEGLSSFRWISDDIK